MMLAHDAESNFDLTYQLELVNRARRAAAEQKSYLCLLRSRALLYKVYSLSFSSVRWRELFVRLSQRTLSDKPRNFWIV